VFSAEVRFCKCRYNVYHFFGYIDDDDDDDDDADDVSYLMDKNFIFFISQGNVMVFEKRLRSTQSIVCSATCLSTLIVTIDDDDIDEHTTVDK